MGVAPFLFFGLRIHHLSIVVFRDLALGLSGTRADLKLCGLEFSFAEEPSEKRRQRASPSRKLQNNMFAVSGWD